MEQDTKPLDPPPESPPEPETPTASTSEPEPDFEPLEPEAEAEAPETEPEFEPLPGPVPIDNPEPFTGEEIATGVMHLVMLGLRRELSDPAQVEAFQKAFMAAVFPIMPTPAVLDALGVGEALAAYGIHKGMVGGPDALASLPPWLRLLLGGGYLAVAVYMAARAAKEVRHGPQADRAGPGPGAAGPGPGEEANRGPVQAPTPA